MKSYLVIDGYNLLYEIAESQGINLQKENLEDHREALIHKIANYAALSGHETVLVFDALYSDSAVSEEMITGITVVFTGKDESADTYIERYLYSRPRRAHVLLVTSDSKIQDMALLTGAERFSSRQFLMEIEEAEKDHSKFGERDKDKNINKLGEHLGAKELELFERLRLGKK